MQDDQTRGTPSSTQPSDKASPESATTLNQPFDVHVKPAFHKPTPAQHAIIESLVGHSIPMPGVEADTFYGENHIVTIRPKASKGMLRIKIAFAGLEGPIDLNGNKREDALSAGQALRKMVPGNFATEKEAKELWVNWLKQFTKGQFTEHVWFDARWDEFTPSVDNMSIKELISFGMLTPLIAAERLGKHSALRSGICDRPEEQKCEDAYNANQLDDCMHAMRCLQRIIHGLNRHAGWWSDLTTGEPKERNDGELLMLCVTELAEAMEGVRKNLMDDKLPHRKMVEVELADTIIRIFDYAGGRGLDVAGAMIEKLAYNSVREDHTREHRAGEHGKKV